MSLPEITEQSIIIVDATPDEEYPLRILKAYRQNCNAQWGDTTNPDSPVANPLLKIMNEHNNKRADILDRAIARLRNGLSVNLGEQNADGIDAEFVWDILTENI